MRLKMKYILVLLSFLYVVPAYAMEKSECLKKVESLDIELSRCSINMPENAESTAEMNEAHYKYIDCLTAAADKLFDAMYQHSNKQVKENFNKLVEAVYAMSHDINEHSDITENLGGTIRTTEALSEAEYWIKQLVKNYIKSAKADCLEM